MNELPGSYTAKPVVISEFNHIWKSINGPLGWVANEGAAVVRAAAEASYGWNGLGGQQIAALTVYRWDGDEWAVKNMAPILNMVKKLNQDLDRPKFKYPIQGRTLRINYYFGEQRDYGLHEGIDLYINYGDVIVPVMDGIIEIIKDIGQSGYGRYVRVNHNNGYVSWYGHFRDFAPGIFVGQNVIGGQTVLGFGGNTGSVFPPPTPQNPTAGTHLHLTIQRPGFGLSGFVVNDVVDPLPYLV
jgi:murein DD-endopeptidase MepM/ murein hydrolase activator NlpD